MTNIGKMRLIVNEKQYKELLFTNKNEIDSISEWVDYISDFTINKLENKNLFESILCTNKLNLKLGKFKFFKKLPIDNLVLNIYNEENVKFKCDFDTEQIFINEDNQLKNVVINMEMDKNISLIEQIDKNKLKITLSGIKHWYENNNK